MEEPVEVENKKEPKDYPSKIKKSVKPAKVKESQELITSDISEIKKQLNDLMAIVPVVNKLNLAYEQEQEIMEIENNIENQTQHKVGDDCSDIRSDTDRGECSYGKSSSVMDYFKNLSGTVVKERPKIDEEMAQGIHKVLCQGLDIKEKEGIMEKYCTPENCKRMEALQCNLDIFKMVDMSTRQVDSNMQKIQNVLLKSLMSYCFDTLSKLDKNVEVQSENFNSALTSCADSIALLADGSYNLDICRRKNFKKQLKPEFQSLCSQQVPCEEFLFGKELSEKIKEVSEANKLSQKVHKRFSPYPKPNNKFRKPFFFKKKLNFLGKRSPLLQEQRKGQLQEFQTGEEIKLFPKESSNVNEYDYVFSVDIKEGAPPLKLPFNITEDPWMAAQKFIYKHDLPQVYLDQVANFIIENTKGVTLGMGSSTEYSDPFTGGDRYVPSKGDSNEVNRSVQSDPFTGGNRYLPDGQQSSAISNSHFPHTTHLFFDTASPAHQIIGKLKEFNSQVEPGLQVEDLSLDCLNLLLSEGKANEDAVKLLDTLLQWPQENVFPVLDILRMAIKDPKLCDLFCSRPDFIDQLSQFASTGNIPATRMLSLRTLTNLFRHPNGAKLNLQHIDSILQSTICCKDLITKNGQIAFSTLLLDYCVQLRSQDDLENKSKCLQAIAELLPLGLDSEATYRLLVALGTLIVDDDGCKAVAQSIELPSLLPRFQSSSVAKIVECASLISAAFS